MASRLLRKAVPWLCLLVVTLTAVRAEYAVAESMPLGAWIIRYGDATGGRVQESCASTIHSSLCP